jgi:membrane protease YdiL (CAAX protease family)
MSSIETQLDDVHNSNRTRSLELLLILCIAFLSPTVISLYVWLTGIQYYSSLNHKALTITLITAILQRLLSIALLIYVLYKQQRKISDIGFSFSWKDIPKSFILFIVQMALFYLSYFVLVWLKTKMHVDLPVAAKNIDFIHGGISIWLIAYMLVNPFHEELIVRSYLITEVEYLTRNTKLAVFISVLFQTTYHLYQGVIPAISYMLPFLIFSLYFVKTRRIAPVILAHLYVDLLSLIHL